MTRHIYPKPALLRDAIIALAGTALCFLPLFALEGLITGLVSALIAFGALFTIYAGHILLRLGELVSRDGDGLRQRTVFGGREISWAGLRDVRLRYFRTGRLSGREWMELRLSDGVSTIRIESSMTGFADILAQTMRAAAASGIKVNQTTLENLKAAEGMA